jgi:hypothetical protein
MPRRIALERRGLVGELTERQREILLSGNDWFDGPLGPAFEDDGAIRQAWEEHGSELLEQHIATSPGTRPYAWWRYDSNGGSRKQLGGVGTPLTGHGLYLGMPDKYGMDYDCSNAPKVESECSYLKRHNLLTEVER